MWAAELSFPHDQAGRPLSTHSSQVCGGESKSEVMGCTASPLFSYLALPLDLNRTRLHPPDCNPVFPPEYSVESAPKN